MGASFAVDFVGGDLKAAAPKGIEPVITLSSGEAKQIEISILNPLMVIVFSLTGIRLRTPTDPVDMRMYLRCQGDAISETWLYQYFPPAPDKRQYVDDRVMS
ncbi:glucans biosynthesis protein D [Escherichia coli]|uniref:Glucans biosynthesis protein D n=1 Tax=Escherichia coli TaxID=562 RepID=A0A2X3LVJ6_ECOLX|nr:glucans biosynthesis protein D [Escherichia coli]